MHVGIGYSEHPETDVAGANAAKRALNNANRGTPCDLVLLFSTAGHNPYALRGAVAAVVGENVPIIGGAAVGVISNDRFGYAGDQVGLAAVWLEGAGFGMYSKGGLVDNEEEVGRRIGLLMAEEGIRPDTPCMLFYDAINRTRGDVRLNLATPLLQGLEQGLGFLPANLVGAGLQGDYACSPTMQWTGRKTIDQFAMMLTFSGGPRIDSAIMHGCRPTPEIFTVTKAERQTILEVNDMPALSFIHSKLQPSLPVETFPFFMIFGVNRAPGREYSETNYANRLCLGIDRDRDGIVMFESDMVPGTKFQIMYRSLDLDYIRPKIDALFARVASEGRKPVFAFYIDCAGRAADYGGDQEDAPVVQDAVAGRAPLLGIYSGVEIAPILGRPRTLDWTGVFCLFSTP